MTDLEKEIKELEKEKLEVEIKQLNQPFFRKPVILIAIFVPLIGAFITYLLNKDYVQQSQLITGLKQDLKEQQLKFQEVDIKKREDSLGVDLKRKENALLKMNEQMLGLSDSLTNLQVSLDSALTKNKRASERYNLLNNTLGNLQADLKEKELEIKFIVDRYTYKVDSIKTGFEIVKTQYADSLGIAKDEFDRNRKLANINSELKDFTKFCWDMGIDSRIYKYSSNHASLIKYSNSERSIKLLFASTNLPTLSEDYNKIILDIDDWVNNVWKKKGKVKRYRDYAFFFREVEDRILLIQDGLQMLLTKK